MEISSATPGLFHSRVVSSGELEEGSARLSGRTFDDRGRPLAEVSISLAGSGFWPSRTVTSGADGRFDWPEIPAGIYELRASKGSLVAPSVEGLILDAGARRAFGLRLAEGWTLAGQVIDAQSGRALQDAEVTAASGALGLYTRQTRSDSHGKFELTGIVGEQLSVYVEADGYVTAGPLPGSSAEPRIILRLERASAIEGRVVDEDGRPILGALVRAFGEGEPRPALLRAADALPVTAGPVPPISAAGTAAAAFVREVESGRDGRFRVPDLRPGSYTLAASHDAFAAAESARISVGPDAEHSGVSLVMRPGAELAGRVVDERGDGLEGIPVELRSPEERMPRMTVTASDGSFSFRGVRGELSVTALPYDLPAVRAAVAMEDDALVTVELALSSTLYTLHGRVVDERGFGVGGAHLTVSSKLPGSDLRRSAKSDSDGTFSVPALPPPPFELNVEHPGYGPSRLSTVDRVDDVRVVMSAGVNLLGEVRDGWTGDGLGSVLVEIDGPIKRGMRSRKDGSFEFPLSPTGTYEVSFSHPDYESQVRRVVLEAPRYVDRPQEIDTVRLEPGGSIEGEILDARSEPVPGAEVTWGDPPRWERATRSDPRGHFLLRGVPAGAVWIAARHPAAGEAWSDEWIRVRPLETSPAALVHLPEELAE